MECKAGKSRKTSCLGVYIRTAGQGMGEAEGTEREAVTCVLPVGPG